MSSRGSKKTSDRQRQSKKRAPRKETKKGRRRSTTDQQPAGSAASGSGARQRSAAPATAEPAGGKSAAAERIYAFADQLSEARQREEGQEPEERSESWVSFVLGDQLYALPVPAVHEILRVGQITRVPHAPTSVLGVCNRRGRVLPVVDLRHRLGLEGKPSDTATRIVVVSAAGRLLGLLVDSVRQVEAIRPSQVQPPPESVTELAGGAVQGVVEQHGRMTILLELASLLQLQRAIGEKIA